MSHPIQVKESDVMYDNNKVIKDFEEAVKKARGEGWDYVDLLTDDGFKILAILEEQGNQIDDLEEKLYGKDKPLVIPVMGRWWHCPVCLGRVEEFDEICPHCRKVRLRWK